MLSVQPVAAPAKSRSTSTAPVASSLRADESAIFPATRTEASVVAMMDAQDVPLASTATHVVHCTEPWFASSDATKTCDDWPAVAAATLPDGARRK